MTPITAATASSPTPPSLLGPLLALVLPQSTLAGLARGVVDGVKAVDPDCYTGRAANKQPPTTAIANALSLPAWAKNPTGNYLVGAGLTATVTDQSRFNTDKPSMRAAARALIQLGDDYVRRAVLGIVRPSSPLIEISKLDALSFFGDAAIPTLKQLASNARTPSNTRVLAIKALMQLDSEASIAALKGLLSEESDERSFVAQHVARFFSVTITNRARPDSYFQRAQNAGVIHCAQSVYANDLLYQFCTEQDGQKRAQIVLEINVYLLGDNKLPGWKKLVTDMMDREQNLGADERILRLLTLSLEPRK